VVLLTGNCAHTIDANEVGPSQFIRRKVDLKHLCLSVTDESANSRREAAGRQSEIHQLCQ
jgi:hypothetical protein